MAFFSNGTRTDVGDGRPGRYGGVAIGLHWGIAVCVIYNLLSGLLRSRLPPVFFALHESSGITILALTLVRIGWRLTHRPPPDLAMPRWQSVLAHIVHAGFYAAMLVLPLSGWALVSATPPLGSPGAAWYVAHLPPAPPGGGVVPMPHVIRVFGGLALPGIAPVRNLGRLPAGVPGQRVLHERIKRTHLLGGYVMLMLMLLHVAGVAKHQLLDRQRQLARMGVGRA